ncbi:hypothetical protein K470DRAFT_71727 [Piedraia hortae CBS 480.64]|uniref:Uncharacterized protein n=1 Tax=Piedraia hortae CBS 480.64 TaxID=1314780 RepID=A0A6A7BZ58_9PEZI|nr:hypothetical protein K470DRAFT_71727 [Piedraia hortae CBS 480.64]
MECLVSSGLRPRKRLFLKMSETWNEYNLHKHRSRTSVHSIEPFARVCLECPWQIFQAKSRTSWCLANASQTNKASRNHHFCITRAVKLERFRAGTCPLGPCRSLLVRDFLYAFTCIQAGPAVRVHVALGPTSNVQHVYHRSYEARQLPSCVRTDVIYMCRCLPVIDEFGCTYGGCHGLTSTHLALDRFSSFAYPWSGEGQCMQTSATGCTKRKKKAQGPSHRGYCRSNESATQENIKACWPPKHVNQSFPSSFSTAVASHLCEPSVNAFTLPPLRRADLEAGAWASAAQVNCSSFEPGFESLLQLTPQPQPVTTPLGCRGGRVSS